MEKEKPLNYQQHVPTKVSSSLDFFFLSCVEVVVEFDIVAVVV